MAKKDKNKKKEKKRKICAILEALCCGFSLAGDDDVDWDEVERVDRIVAKSLSK